MTGNLKFSGIPIIFFTYFHHSLIPRVAYFLLPYLWRVNKKFPQDETSPNTFQRSRSISWKWKKVMVKCSHPPLSLEAFVIFWKWVKKFWTLQTIDLVHSSSEFDVDGHEQLVVSYLVNYPRLFYCSEKSLNLLITYFLFDLAQH